MPAEKLPGGQDLPEFERGTRWGRDKHIHREFTAGKRRLNYDRASWRFRELRGGTRRYRICGERGSRGKMRMGSLVGVEIAGCRGGAVVVWDEEDLVWWRLRRWW